MKIKSGLIIIALLVGFSALVLECSPAEESVFTSEITSPPAITNIPTAPPTMTYTPYSRLNPTSLPETPTPQMEICSPLEGITLQELPETIFNPFNPPRPGSDDPHQGVDFSDIDPFTQIALEGMPVQSVMDGTVAAVVRDRFPYGNAILIETTFNILPDVWLPAILLPTPDPGSLTKTGLTCPEIKSLPGNQIDERSLYLLYAHLKESADFQIGDLVSCGQIIGHIGNSGNSLNPHLHLEARIGPAGSVFESMSHYNTSASPEEMANYCLWRVSGQFSLADPMSFLSISP